MTGRVGVAFGGGGARGIAHFGALRVLRRRPDFLPTIVAGTSAGSIAATLYAAGLSQERLEELVREFAWFRDVISFSDTVRHVLENRRGGLVSNAALAEVVNELVEGKGFDELETDLAVVAADVEQRRRVVFTSSRVAARLSHEELERFLPPPTSRWPGCDTQVLGGFDDVGLAVRASCAVPGVFLPVEVEGMRLLDGGVVDTVPVDVVRAMGADLTIGISLALAFFPQRFRNAVNVMSAVVGLLGVQQLRKSLEAADIGFQVSGIDRRSVVDTRQFDLMDIAESDMDRELNLFLRKRNEAAAAAPGS